MAFRKQDRTLLAHWLKQKKQETRKKDDALEAGKIWFKRARLAAKEGKQELAQEAHRRALEAKEEHDKATRRLESIAMELEVLRGTAEPKSGIDPSAASRAEQIQENFAAIGINSEVAELEELADRSGAERALGRLKQSLNGGEILAPDASEKPAFENADSSSIPRLSELMEQGAAAKVDGPEGSDLSVRPVDPVDSASVDSREDVDATGEEPDSRRYRDSGVAADEPTEGDSDDSFSFEKLGPKAE